MSATNPYAAAGSVASGPRFIGRAEIVELLMEVVVAGLGSRALIGHHKVGKSSIAMRVYERASESQGCRGVVLDVSTCPGEHSLFSAIATAIEDAGGADGLSAAPDPYQAVRRHLLAKSMAGERTVLVLDEFDSVVDTANATLSIRRLREIVSQPSRFALTVLIVCRRRLARIEQQIANLSTFEGVCPAIYIQPFPHADVTSMVERGFDHADEVAAQVHAFSGGHPYIAELALFHLFRGARRLELESLLAGELRAYFSQTVRALLEDNSLATAVAIARGEALKGSDAFESLVQYGVCRRSTVGAPKLWIPAFADYLRQYRGDVADAWSTDPAEEQMWLS